MTNDRHGPASQPNSPLVNQALNTLDAVDLIQRGARVPLICQLTHLEKATVRRLYRQIKGYHAPAGQAPFTDTWYLKNDARLLQASIIWYLHRAFVNTDHSLARSLIKVYDCYTRMVQQILFDITRTAFVPDLLKLNLWVEQTCDICTLDFIGPLDPNENSCPSCRQYHRFRCRHCGTSMQTHASGRYRQACAGCTQNRAGRRRRSSTDRRPVFVSSPPSQISQ